MGFVIKEGVLKKYSGKETEIIIPDKVRIIGRDAFSRNDTIIRVILHDSIEGIESDAFSYCSHLTEINLPGSIKSIGSGAFSHCKSLKTIHLPNGIQSIGANTFYSCESLERINIPSTVKAIGSSAFQFMEHLEVIDISDIKAWVSMAVGKYVQLFNNRTKLLLNGEIQTDIKLPIGCDRIGNRVFDGYKGITSIVIPEGVTSIGEEAFSYCLKLEKISFPKSLKQMSLSTFYSCKIKELNIEDISAWASISISKPDHWMGGLPSPFSDQTKLFLKGKEIDNLVIPGTIGRIGSYAFMHCTSINTIEICEGVSDIGDYAFFGCKSIEKIKFPSSIKTIGDSAFKACSSLKEVFIPDMQLWSQVVFKNDSSPVVEGVSLLVNGERTNGLSIDTHIENNNTIYSGHKEIETIIINEGVTEIPPKAYEKCTNLKKVVIPTSLKKIGYYAFEGCDHIEEVHIESLSSWMAIDFGSNPFFSNPLSRGAKLMINNTLVEEVEVPEDIRSIGLAFHRYDYLLKLKMHRRVMSVKDQAFFWCKSLSHVELSPRLLFISASMFEKCESLKTLCLPAGLETIQEKAFKGCKSLDSLLFPDTLLDVEKEAFAQTGITSIIIPLNIKKLGEKSFYDCQELRSITIESSNTSLGEALFSGCSKLKVLQFPEGIDILSAEMFRYCSFTHFTIPETVKMLGSEVLAGNPIKVLYVPNSVNQLDYESLVVGTRLEEVSLPGLIERIDKEAFGYRFVDEHKIIKVVVRGHKFSPSILECLRTNKKCLNIVFAEALSGEIPLQYRKHMTEYWINKAMNHEQIDDEVFSSYYDYLKTHKKDWLTKLSSEDDIIIRFMVREKLITLSEIDELITRVSGMNEPELLATLMEYQNSNFSFDDYEKEYEKEFDKIKKAIAAQPMPGTQAYINKFWTVSRSGPYVNKLKYTESKVSFPEKVGSKKITGISDDFKFLLDNKPAANLVKEIILPETYSYIGNWAFMSCPSGLIIHITSADQWLRMNLHYSLPSKTSLFIGDTPVNDIRIPSTVNQINDFAFANIENIKSCIIEEGIERIGEHSFSSCINLQSVTIPASVKAIGSNAFSNCSQLKTIRFLGVPQSIAYTALWDCRIVVVANEVTTEMLHAIPYGTLIFASNYKTIINDRRYRARSLNEYNESSLETKEYCPLKGMTFAVTGDLKLFPDRDDMIQFIRSCGGEYTSSVTKKTSHLLTNFKSATTTKYKKAKDNNIQIINEDSLLALVSQE